MSHINLTTKDLLERRKQRLFHGEHLLRHLVSGLFVFVLSVAADVFVTRYLLHHPALSAVIPKGSIVLTNQYVTNVWEIPISMTNVSWSWSNQVQVGLHEQGYVVWRKREP